MKKIVAALLVLTMVLALTGSAMAGCKFPEGKWVEFKKNAPVYNCVDGKAKKAIVHKGSTSQVVENYKDEWVKLYIDDIGTTRWFKTDALKGWKGKKVKMDDGTCVYLQFVRVTYAQGGVGMSKYYEETEDIITPSCYKYVKADKGSVWMHKHSCLKYNLGQAIPKGKKGKYQFAFGVDERGVLFWKVRYNGKCGFVSSEYTTLTKK